MKFVTKLESDLTDIVLQKTSKSMTNLSPQKRDFLMMYVYEHFKLDMNVQSSGKGTKIFTDVFWKEGCRVPEMLSSEVVELSVKGIIKANNEETMR